MNYLWGAPMSESGQSRWSEDVRVTSALPLITDLRRQERHVRNVPRREGLKGEQIWSASPPIPEIRT
jgi:hypothetical protein